MAHYLGPNPEGQNPSKSRCYKRGTREKSPHTNLNALPRTDPAESSPNPRRSMNSQRKRGEIITRRDEQERGREGERARRRSLGTEEESELTGRGGGGGGGRDRKEVRPD